eukprot:CAMPEP_0172789972 /NCGR_PEP_ID=MMETSP1074-20121228/207728_1 /TAXON_ID=2916 /ORGANISM="Ceratium fusus, Strain PA161109" /LENGTH=94 /DNA_ID=CAMNT_0013627015 /DNA_START=569 /DNA_END=854 /DNA_ORIENTATION=+
MPTPVVIERPGGAKQRSQLSNQIELRRQLQIALRADMASSMQKSCRRNTSARDSARHSTSRHMEVLLGLTPFTDTSSSPWSNPRCGMSPLMEHA